ncbi:MAG: hypothetical protein WCC66_05005 [Rhizobiaceae bacterium]
MAAKSAEVNTSADKPQPGLPVRQAVIVIHGMGEQRPMETLRRFVEGVGTPGSASTAPAIAKGMVQNIWDRMLGDRPPAEDMQFWIVPDGRTGSHELSRIRLRPVTVSNTTIRTDYYELYYADELTGTSLQQLWGWVKGLMFRWPHQVPKAQLVLWLALWAIVSLSIALLGPELANSPFKRLGEFLSSGDGTRGIWAAVLCIAGGLSGVWFAVAKVRSHVDHRDSMPLEGTFSSAWSFALAVFAPIVLALLAYFILPWNSLVPDPKILAEAAKADIFSAAVIILFGWPILKFLVAAALYFIIYQFGVPVFGDVARYVSAAPGSIGSREKIRLRGLGLLKTLHDAKVKDVHGNDTDKPEYDRFIVAAHSLGSIIALDVLRLFWAQQGPGQKMALDANEVKALQAVDSFCGSLADKDGRLDPSLVLTGTNAADDFFELQRQAASVLATGSSRWRITDFVTMGSPLAHAEFLIARDKPRFRKMIEERIIPQCPPLLERLKDAGAVKWSFIYTPGSGGGPRPHHAALFSCMRWTALYDPRRWQVFGDFVGGQLKPNFGPGVAQVPVRIRRGGGLLPRLITHTDYWNPGCSGLLVTPDGGEISSAAKAGLPAELDDLGRSKSVHIDALRAILFRP